MTGPQSVNPPFNLARHCLARSASETPDKPALIVYADAGGEASETWTYSQLEQAVLSVAGGLAALGAERGSRLLIRLENTSAYPIVFLGAIAAGLVPIPTSTQLTAPEAAFLMQDSGASIVVLPQRLGAGCVPDGVTVLSEGAIAAMIARGQRSDYADTRSEDPAYLIYTSGTTAQPKGVIHAQRVILGRKPMYFDWYAISRADRVLHAGAFNWTYTLGTGLMDPWVNGAASIIFTGDKRPEVWPQLIRKSVATIFAAVPSVFRQVLKYAPDGMIDVGSLRHGLIAGERPPEELFDAWYARTETRLHEALGMSELSTYISTSPFIPRRPGTTGKAQSGRRVAILAENGGTEPVPAGTPGLIGVHRSDPGLMLGYWNRPEEEAGVFRGEWFVGGDIGSMDEDGYITHLGRANDIMKALGYRVAPQEVEAALAEHPDVAEVACAEVQVRADVSVIGAFIVPKPGAQAQAEAILGFAAARLAPYKCPREIIFVDSLPRTPNGKVKRSALRTGG